MPTQITLDLFSKENKDKFTVHQGAELTLTEEPFTGFIRVDLYIHGRIQDKNEDYKCSGYVDLGKLRNALEFIST